jgi:hypothetical protein
MAEKGYFRNCRQGKNGISEPLTEGVLRRNTTAIARTARYSRKVSGIGAGLWHGGFNHLTFELSGGCKPSAWTNSYIVNMTQ